MSRRGVDFDGSLPDLESELPVLDRDRFNDPEYLAGCRQFASWLLVRQKSSVRGLASARKWIEDSAVVHKGVAEGVLFAEEIDHVLKSGLVYPLSWTTKRAQIDVPRKYDVVLGLFLQTIPYLAESGLVVGLASGVFDVLHAGHLLFLQECKKQCDVLIVGVDENWIVSRVKGQNRPYNDFSVRVGALSEMNEVDFLCRVPGVSLKTSPYFVPYMTFFYDLDVVTLAKYMGEKKFMELKDPDWYRGIGPNLRFFMTEGDPAMNMKLAGADYMGGRAIVIPKYTNLSTTRIAEHFDLKPSGYKPDRFGKDPWATRRYTSLPS